MHGLGRPAKVLSNGVSLDGVRKDSCSVKERTFLRVPTAPVLVPARDPYEVAC
jgi:hypothetical protein